MDFGAMGTMTSHHGSTRLWAFVFGLAVGPQLFGLPAGVDVVSGNAVVRPISNGKLVIEQSSNKAILNWQSFSIAAGEQVQFIQPTAQAIALNRVVGNDASRIYGSLTANGRVFLINAHGVFFAPSASVDTGAFVASAHSIRDEDFLAGRYVFTGPGLGEVSNEGTITAGPNGYVLLSGSRVSNEGFIRADRGSVGLASGARVEIDTDGDGLVRFSVDGAALGAAIRNSGAIVADGGRVSLLAVAAQDALGTVVNQSGLVQANSISERDGVITLSGGPAGVVSVSGAISAAGTDPGETGGTIRVLGDRVAVLEGARLDATGDRGGGNILIGGNLRGEGPEQNASRTFVAANAVLDASALDNGDAGSIVVWSNHGTRFFGTANARGG
ncbi:MAG: filamentous hemagglutinin N-terminal domain-containing protein, partial [Sinobacteraceae bacterium]|nr:filamentous hemagglutinin N-terminal domain-containing protein [Nevskiaceae bacterium]